MSVLPEPEKTPVENLQTNASAPALTAPAATLPQRRLGRSNGIPVLNPRTYPSPLLPVRLATPSLRNPGQVEFEAFDVVLGEPKLIFSITNSPDDVIHGFLELVGPATSAQKLSFGPVVERIVVEPFAPDYLWFDLDTKRTVALTNYFKSGFDPELKAHTEAESRPYQEEFKRQKVASGVDISARLEGIPPDFGKPPALMCLEMAIMPTFPLAWTELKAELLCEEIASQPLKGQGKMEFKGLDEGGPATYGFRTFEGSIGILQVWGYESSTNRHIKIRYKLVQTQN